MGFYSNKRTQRHTNWDSNRFLIKIFNEEGKDAIKNEFPPGRNRIKTITKEL